MPHSLRFVRLVVAVSLVGITVGCAGAAATGDVDKIQVAISQFDITVTNTAGTSLNDVVAEVHPTGPGSGFVARIGTLGNAERRSVTHAGFTDRDGVSFSMRTAKPSRVIVSGTAPDGKTVRVDVPFKL